MAVSGHVFVMDFGLARATEGASDVSVSGQVIGTPAYMSPEQARGERVDARADVYGLGATLYELLAGAPPFKGANVYDTLKRLQEQEPAPPRRIDASIPADLEVIVLKCLEKERAQRYADASELAADLGRYLEGEPIHGRPASFVYRVRRRLAKRKAVVAVAGAGAAALAAAIVLLLPRLLETRRTLELWRRVSVVLQDADVHARAGDLPGARRRLDEGIAICRARPDSAAVRYFLGRLLHERGDRAGSLRELDRAVEIDPGFVEARFARGLVRVEEYGQRLLAAQRLYGSWTRPVDEFEAEQAGLRGLRAGAIDDLSVRMPPDTYFRAVDVEFGRAELARLRDPSPEAKAALAKIVEREPLYWRALLSLANFSANRFDHDEAVAWAAKTIEAHKGVPRAHHTRAVALHRKGREAVKPQDRRDFNRRAVEDTDRAIALGDDSTDIWAIRGAARSMLGEHEKAVADLTEAIHRNPMLPEAHVLRGLAYEKRGNHEGAIADLERASQISPGNANIHGCRAGVLFMKGDIDGALGAYADARRAEPANAWWWMMTGETLEWKGDVAAAIDAYARGTEADPRDAECWRHRGLARAKRGDVEGGLADCRRAVEAKPDSAAARDSLGYVRQQSGDVEGALRDYDEAIRLDPTLMSAWSNRGFARLAKGDTTGAIGDFERCLAVAPAEWPARPIMLQTIERLRKK